MDYHEASIDVSRNGPRKQFWELYRRAMISTAKLFPIRSSSPTTLSCL